MSINHRIAQRICELENIKNFISCLEIQKNLISENLENLISQYMQEHDEIDIQSLIRYLYWYSDMPTGEIGKIVDMSTQKIVAISGTIVKEGVCTRCTASFVTVRSSRSDMGKNLCPTCTAQDQQIQDQIFLDDWIIQKKNLPVSNVTYSQYLNSNHWKKVRKEALRRSNFKCQLCSVSKVVLHVHHNNYDCIGQEKEEDVIVLCAKCHNRVHNEDYKGNE